ncbi:20211_t:CDS:2, partial [Cetraspora pellucida]
EERKKKTKQLTICQEVSSSIKATYESVVQFQDQTNEDNQISIYKNINIYNLKMSKRKHLQREKDSEEEVIEVTSKLQKTKDVEETPIVNLNEIYEFYAKQKKWKLIKDVKEKSFIKAFPDKQQ